MSRVNYTSRIEGKTKISTILWTVPRFMKLLENKSGREFRTDKAKDETVDQTIESRFQLKMQFLGHNNDIIEIYYLSPKSVFLKSVLNICLNNFKERSLVVKEYHTVHANKWQYLTTLFKRDIDQDGRDKFLLSDGSLRLNFQFLVSNDIIIDRSNAFEVQLSNDIENLLHNSMFSDVTMKSIEGDEFKVHKAVLSSRSAVLKAHFDHNTTECFTNIIESPLEAEVLREILTFVYSDKAPQIDDIPEKVLAAADYYQLSRLRGLCEEALHKKLTVDNAIETLQLADLHSAATLKQSTLEFIKDGQTKLITKTEGWAKLKSVELIKCIYEHIVADDGEPDIK